MQVKTQGLIIREQTVGESDRLVTVLTRDAGVVRAFARRAKNLKDSKSAATQLLCYSRLSIFKGREKYMIDDAEPIEVSCRKIHVGKLPACKLHVADVILRLAAFIKAVPRGIRRILHRGISHTNAS